MEEEEKRVYVHPVKEEDSEDSHKNQITPDQSFDEDEWKELNPEEYSKSHEAEERAPQTTIEITDDIKDPVKFYHYFFPRSLFRFIAEQTNIYFFQFTEILGDALGGDFPKSRLRRWEDVTTDQMKSFCGILFLMGINRRTNIKDHWSKDKNLVSPVADIIPQNKFDLIYRFIHLNNIETSPRKKDKISIFLNKLVEIWNKFYIPSSKLALDETTVGYKGRTEYLQYNKNKPDKLGLKFFSLADSANHYMLNMKLYEGRKHPLLKGLNLSETATFQMLSPYKGKKYCIYMDSYFSSPTLFKTLSKNGFDCIGTVRRSRKGFSKEIQYKQTTQGDIVVYTNNDMQFMIWDDKNIINVMSTIQNTETVQKERRNRRSHGVSKITKPKIICDYIKHMRGVDLSDQMSGYYTMDTKHLKWWRACFLRLLNINMTNCYIFYITFIDKTMTHKKFVTLVVEDMINSYCWIERPALTIDATKFFLKNHQNRARLCKQCQKSSGKRRTSLFLCRLCGKPVCAFCYVPHIETVHIQSDDDDDDEDEEESSDSSI